MVERLKKLRKYLKMSQGEFGKKIELSASAIGEIERGTNKLTDRNIEAISRVFNVNPDWLRDGVGEMFSPPKETDWLTQLIEEYQLDDVEVAMLKSYLELPHEMRQMVIEYGKNFLRNMQGVELADDRKPDEELTVAEKRRIVNEELDAEEKGQILSASIATSGSKKSRNYS